MGNIGEERRRLEVLPATPVAPPQPAPGRPQPEPEPAPAK